MKTFNPNLGWFFRGSFRSGVGRGVKLPSPGLKIVRIMLSVSTYIWHVSRHRYAVLKNIRFSTYAFLIWLMSAFFSKKSAFFGKTSTFT